MTNREITTLMHRLFPGDLGPVDYVHLMVDGQLDRARVDALLDRYIRGDEVLIFVDINHCAAKQRKDTFNCIREFIQYGRVRVADPRFQGRVIIEPLGVGAGELN